MFDRCVNARMVNEKTGGRKRNDAKMVKGNAKEPRQGEKTG